LGTPNKNRDAPIKTEIRNKNRRAWAWFSKNSAEISYKNRKPIKTDASPATPHSASSRGSTRPRSLSQPLHSLSVIKITTRHKNQIAPVKTKRRATDFSLNSAGFSHKNQRIHKNQSCHGSQDGGAGKESGRASRSFASGSLPQPCLAIPFFHYAAELAIWKLQFAKSIPFCAEFGLVSSRFGISFQLLRALLYKPPQFLPLRLGIGIYTS